MEKKKSFRGNVISGSSAYLSSNLLIFDGHFFTRRALNSGQCL